MTEWEENKIVSISSRMSHLVFQRINTSFSFLADLVSLVLVCLLFSNWYLDAGTRYAPTVCATQGRDFVTSSLCDHNASLTCLRGYESSSDGTCSLFPAPLTQSCTNSCHVVDAPSAHCDTLGHCVVDTINDCYGGFCSDDSECYALFEINNNLTNSHDLQTNYSYDWYEPAACYFGRCSIAVAELMVGTLEVNYFYNDSQPYSPGVPINLRYLCTDYLDPDYYATYGQCLEIERYALDPATNRYNLLTTDANYTYPVQMELCIFYYKCSRVDVEAWWVSSLQQPQKRNTNTANLRARPLVSGSSNWPGASKKGFLDRVVAGVEERLPHAIGNLQKKRRLR